MLFCGDMNIEDACTMKPKYREQAKTPFVVEEMQKHKPTNVESDNFERATN